MPVAFLYKSFDSAPDDALAYLLAYGHSDPVPIGLIPDYMVNYTISDLMMGKDLEMEFVVSDIQRRAK